MEPKTELTIDNDDVESRETKSSNESKTKTNENLEERDQGSVLDGFDSEDPKERILLEK
jgi:hypothetical protein